MGANLQKTFCEILVAYKCADPVLNMDIFVDDLAFFGLTGVIDPKSLFDRSMYNESHFDSAPVYRAKFLMPFDATGYMLSLRIYTTTNSRLKIENIDVFYALHGLANKEKE
jgi:hypothetical protein